MADRIKDCFTDKTPARDHTACGQLSEDLPGGKDSGNGLPDLSCEKELLLSCSRAGIAPEDTPRLNDLLSSPLDWEFISEAARYHNISQILYHNLKGLPSRDLVPPRVMEGLERSYRETIAKNMFLYAELETVLDAFRRRGLDVIVLKGAALAGIVYPDIGLRPMTDIDILVKEDELEIADRVMGDLDYHTVRGVKPRRWFRKSHFHLPPYRHARKPVIVEIHWHVTGNCSATDIRQWWKRAKIRDLMGYRMLVPSPEDMLIHLAVHLFNHDYENGFVLRCLSDIYEMLRHYRSEVDWEFLQSETAGQGMERQVHSMLYLARRLYAPEDRSIIAMNLNKADLNFLRVLENNLFVSSGSVPLNPYLLKSMMLDGLSRKAAYLLAGIFPPPGRIAEAYHTSPSSMMIPFYYIARPFLLLSRYGKSAAAIFGTKNDRT